MGKSIATLPSASDPDTAAVPMRIVVVGNRGCKRIKSLNEALDRRGLPPATLVPWLDLIHGTDDLRRHLAPGIILRLESPGRDFQTEKALLALGAATADLEPYASISARELELFWCDKGRILWPRQWYRGFRSILAQLVMQLREAPAGSLILSDPAEIACMFDKPACHKCLQNLGIPVPPTLGEVSSYDELTGRMQAHGCWRVFVKLAHGSSASGVVAYRTNGRAHQAVTTVEIANENGEMCLYNTRWLRLLTSQREIAQTIDALCRHRVHVERWLPKAVLAGRALDLRVLTIGGEPRHMVVRRSTSPITNLHLLNERADASALRQRMSEAAWQKAMETCRRTAAAFPRSQHTGIDLLLCSDLHSHAVAEVNAFGDQLNGALHEGMTTYEAELDAALLATAGGAPS